VISHKFGFSHSLIAFHSGEANVVIGGTSEAEPVSVWNMDSGVSTGQLTSDRRLNLGSVTCLATATVDGQDVVVGGGNSVWVWSPETKSTIAIGESLSDLAFGPRKHKILGREFGPFQYSFVPGIFNLAITKLGGRDVAITTVDTRSIWAWNLRDACRMRPAIATDSGRYLGAADLGYEAVVVTGEDGAVELWRLSSSGQLQKTEQLTRPANRNPVSSIATI